LPIVAWSAVVVGVEVAWRGETVDSLAMVAGVLGVDMVGRSGSAGRPGVIG